MKFNSEIIKYLSGKKFDNGLKIKISHKENSNLSRLNLIKDLVKDKKVIHLGCCDHIPLIDEKIKNNIWLHKIITDSSKKCLGVDIDEKGINFLQEKLNYKNVTCADITQENIPDLEGNKWDYILIGEILEHVNNPTFFLKSIIEKYKEYIDKFIITVPNAFSLTNFKGVRNGVENINTDHKFWFTPYTLAKIGFESGLHLEEFFFVQETINNKIGLKAKMLIFPYFKRKIRQKMLLKYPAFREGLLATFNVI